MRRELIVFTQALLLVFLLQSVCFGQFPLTQQELHKLRRLSAASVSPDGTKVAYQIRTWDEKTNKVANHIEITSTNGGGALYVTQSKFGVSDSSPVWSPDSKGISFLSTRSGSSQIWYVNLSDLTTLAQVSDYPVDVTSFKWPEHTNFIVFTADVYPDCADLTCTANRDTAVAARGENTGFVYDQLFVRHWDTWATGKLSHVFIQGISSGGGLAFNGSPKDIMLGMKAESPIAPFGGSEQYSVSPDGKEIAINLDFANRDQAWSTGWKIFTVAINNGVPATPQWLTKNISARTQNPLHSPDGSAVAYLSMDRPGLESDRLHLEVYNKTTGHTYKVTDTWDRSIVEYSWIGTDSFFLTAIDYGVTKLFICRNTPSASVQSQSEGYLQQFSAPISIRNTKSYIVTLQSYFAPTDVWRFTLGSSGLQSIVQITEANPTFNSFEMSIPTSFTFTVNTSVQVQGWVFKPINFNPAKKYPVAHLIHGGPEGSWSSKWSYGWNPQIWTSNGYAVVMINPPGSVGQGQAYTDAVINDWGGLPFQALMKGIDYALAQHSWMDSARVGALGGSYGGFMANYLNGAADNRYKALVNHDGVFDTVSMAYSTDELWFTESEYCPQNERGCTPWERPEGFERFNPRNLVYKWQTPTLIIHGGKDYRIPISQGISAFTALQRRGIPSKLLYFPLENHWVLNSANGITWFNEVIAWLDQYVKG